MVLTSRLREQIRQVVAGAAPALRADLMELLLRPGYALHPLSECRAGVLALEIHLAVVREPAGRAALLAAAAVELQMEAAYIFDDVADASPHERRGEHLALAIALLTAGFDAAVEAARGCRNPSASLHRYCAAYGEACSGQFLDAMLQRRGAASFEEALESTCLKSGSLGKYVAGFAARVAGANGRGVVRFEEFGSNLFTLAQLVDDLRDACAAGESSDLCQRKATLPVTFFGRKVGASVPYDGMLASDVHKIYVSSGAPLYVAVLAQVYLSRAREDLSLLARRGYAVGGLGRYLESVELGAEEVLGAASAGLVA